MHVIWKSIVGNLFLLSESLAALFAFLPFKFVQFDVLLADEDTNDKKGMNEVQLGGIAHRVELNDEDSNYNDLGLEYELHEDDDENMEYAPPDRNKDDKAENDRDDNQESGFYLLDCDDDVDMTQVRPVARIFRDILVYKKKARMPDLSVWDWGYNGVKK